MTKIQYVLRCIRRCDLILHGLLFEHGDNEHLQAGTEHSGALLWHLEQLATPREPVEEEPAPRSL